MRTISVILIIGWTLTDAQTANDISNALSNRNEAEAIRLIQAGVDANVKDNNDQQSMHYAARFGFDGAVQQLIGKGYGTQINRIDKRGNTPIHVAAQNGNANVMEIFIQNGGNFHKRNLNGKQPLHLAAESGHDNVASLLIKAGADKNAIELEGQTPLHLASMFGHEQVVELLLEYGANVNGRNRRGQKPRDVAVERGQQRIVNLFDGGEAQPSNQKISKYIERVCEGYTVHDPEDFVLEGRPAKPEEFPWMVALGYANVITNVIQYRCGGTIISRNFVLTAAHCCKTDQPPIVVRLGTIHIKDPKDAKNYYIEKIIRHEKYSFLTKKNDIALIRLSQRIISTPDIRPACLETDPRDKDTTIGVHVTGWGTTKADSDALSDVLLTAELRTVPLSECNATYVNYNQDNNKNIAAFRGGLVEGQYCAIDPEFKRDSCRGDSGGPLQIFDKSKTARIVGIVSFGISCGTQLPGIYTRVAHYVDWIASHVWPEAL